MSFRIRVAAIASAVAVAAIGAGYVLSAGAAEPALDKVKATVQKALGPNVEIKSVTKSPLASYFLKRAAGVEKGAQTPGKDPVGQVTMAQIREIAGHKMRDLNANDIDAACRILVGSARSIGLEVVG